MKFNLMVVIFNSAILNPFSGLLFHVFFDDFSYHEFSILFQVHEIEFNIDEIEFHVPETSIHVH